MGLVGVVGVVGVVGGSGVKHVSSQLRPESVPACSKRPESVPACSKQQLSDCKNALICTAGMQKETNCESQQPQPSKPNIPF